MCSPLLTVLFKENVLPDYPPFEQKKWFDTSTFLLKVTNKAERYNVLWYKCNEKQSKVKEMKIYTSYVNQKEKKNVIYKRNNDLKSMS